MNANKFEKIIIIIEVLSFLSYIGYSKIKFNYKNKALKKIDKSKNICINETIIRNEEIKQIKKYNSDITKSNYLAINIIYYFTNYFINNAEFNLTLLENYELDKFEIIPFEKIN